MNKTKLSLVTDLIHRDAKEVLEDAIKEDFETIIIFGFRDGKVFTRKSRSKNALELLGALRAAECEVWER